MIDHPTRRITQGAGIVKGWEAKQVHERIPDTFTYNKSDTIAGPLTPKQVNSNSPTLYIYIYLLLFIRRIPTPTTEGLALINAKEKDQKERRGKGSRHRG